jgi:methyl-accepting chemotaxis protein WspA
MLLNRWKIRTQITVGFAIGLAIFTVIGIVTYRGTQRLITASQEEAHTYQVLNEAEEILSLVKSAETGQRGYLLTSEIAYLEPYNRARSTLQGHIDRLRTLVSDNPTQQVYLQTLESLVAQKLAELENTIRLRQTQGANAALAAVRTDEGKEIMDQLRNLVAQIKERENKLLQARSQVAAISARQTLNSVRYGMPIGIILLALIGYILNRQISRPLSRVSRVARQIADGDLTQSVERTRDTTEVGQLLAAFQNMIKNSNQHLHHSNCGGRAAARGNGQ